MRRRMSMVSTAALWGVALAALALIAGAAPADDNGADAARKAEVLASSRWRRAMHELDEWLASQPIYAPDKVRAIKADLDARVAEMTSYELDYLLDGLDEKLAILESPRAAEAREWLGRYLAVMADDRRAALLAKMPNVLDLSPAEIAEKLAEMEAARAAVEREARDARRARREVAAFMDDSRRAAAADRARMARIRRGDVAFSPYRSQPVATPPFPDSFDSPTVVGVGPWGSFVDVCLPAF